MKTIEKVWLALALLFVMQPMGIAQNVTDIDTAGFRTLFNSLSNKPRIVAILDARCGACKLHRDDLRDVIFNQCDDPDLTGLIVWVKTNSFNTVKSDAETQGLLWTDNLNRVQQFWATTTNEFPDGFGSFSWMSCNYPWDISMLFDAGVTWNGTEPGAPTHCTAKISGCCNSYNINNLKTAVESINACTQGSSSVNEGSQPVKMKMIPNPTNGIFEIELSIDKDLVVVCIINLMGQETVLEKVDNMAGLIQFDLSAYPNGIYFVRLKYDNRYVTQKLIKY